MKTKTKKTVKITDSRRLQWCFDKTIAMMPPGSSLPYPLWRSMIDDDIRREIKK
jgi:hypothetical protein